MLACETALTFQSLCRSTETHSVDYSRKGLDSVLSAHLARVVPAVRSQASCGTQDCSPFGSRNGSKQLNSEEGGQSEELVETMVRVEPVKMS